MSWSFSGTGTSGGLVSALNRHFISANAQDRSQREFEEARPHLIGLLKLICTADGEASTPLVELSAGGSATYAVSANDSATSKLRGTLNVKITTCPSILT